MRSTYKHDHPWCKKGKEHDQVGLPFHPEEVTGHSFPQVCSPGIQAFSLSEKVCAFHFNTRPLSLLTLAPSQDLQGFQPLTFSYLAGPTSAPPLPTRRIIHRPLRRNWHHIDVLLDRHDSHSAQHLLITVPLPSMDASSFLAVPQCKRGYNHPCLGASQPERHGRQDGSFVFSGVIDVYQ